MREILFRGKRLDNGECLRGYLWIGNDHSYITPENVGISYYEKEQCIMAVAYEVDPETVCQYTGMTDKNGRKIFEGDIVKYHFGEDVAPVRFGAYQSCFDSQQAEHCGFYVDWKENRNLRKDLGYWVHMVDAEIVGNIHDNLELIGADKQG